MNLTVNSSEDIQSWNEIIRSFPESHFMQTREWGQVKMQYGWQPIFKTWREGEKIFAAAMILMRTVRFSFLPFKWRILYIPKGPLLGDWTNHDHRKTVLQDLQHIAVKNQAIFIKIDPDITMGYGFPAEEGYTETELGKNVMDQLSNNGWVFSKEQIQFRNTVIIDITQDEAKLLENMKQKTRYNLRLAGKKGVTTRLGREQDFDILYQMYAETAVRDKFIIREKGYYHTLWTTFYRANMARPIIASIDELDIAGLIIFHFSNK
ncbi:MAG: aminoacyltransferase, partial [Chloroflexi bacterium]|nr:aminoacyltransferase [Chloroflexota bacterium]